VCSTKRVLGRAARRIVGRDVSLAWECLRRRRLYDVIFTDGEQVGLPLALLHRLTGRRRRPHHTMIVHDLSVAKKAWPHRLLGLDRHVDVYLVYARWQQRFLVGRLGVAPDKVVLTPFMVDTAFFRPVARREAPQPLVCAPGLERRDYGTLVRAAAGLDARVVIAAGSPWSKRSASLGDAPIPANVEVARFDLHGLRQLYADADLVVVPLHDVPFQAGVTSLLEAMAMGRAVFCSRTRGQTDVVVEGSTGLYVPPGDPAALRSAIDELLADPDRAAAMGRRARCIAEADLDVTTYARRIAGVVLGAVTGPATGADPASPVPVATALGIVPERAAAGAVP
jgi:glycosyltransferase involved in cell wall biosynthesis